MEKEDLIPADQFCLSHQIEFSFIDSLHQLGLVEITTIHDAGFIPSSQLQKLEQFVHFHYELDINPEGIDAISNLLERIHSMQSEITRLRNRLRRYEGEK